MSVVVDALGKQCPIPVVMAKKALAELQTPDTLEILVDNEAAVQNLSKLAASCQLPVRAEKTGEKRFSVTMEVLGTRAIIRLLLPNFSLITCSSS